MVKNEHKNSLRPKAVNKPPKKRRRFRSFALLNQKVHVGSSLHSIVDGSFLTRDNLIKQVPFILFITFLGVFYIANSYNAEKTLIEISRIKKELEELRFEYITTKSNLMFHSKQSEVANKLKNTGVRESVVPPVKIYLTQEANGK
ncbi:MAG: hypothetical protein K0B15_03255 [Lentimicrobium sp.]|nr:hypothetical protein [Lentimicrobium sp.]